jgi:Tol biopolymer transport system component
VAIAIVLVVSLAVWLVQPTDLRRKLASEVVVRDAVNELGHISNASLNPQGRQVAFSWRPVQSKEHEIYIQTVDGGSPSKITDGDVDALNPVWSPTLPMIAYKRASSVFLIGANGKDERKLGEAQGNFLAWTPDGKSLLISDRASDREPFAIVALDVNSGEKKKVLEPWKVDNPESIKIHQFAERRDDPFTVSGDGERLAFLQWLGAGWSSIRVTDLNSSESHLIVQNAGEPFGLAWLPAGDKLLYASDPSRRADGNATLGIASIPIIPTGPFAKFRSWWRPMKNLTFSPATLGLEMAVQPSVADSPESGHTKAAFLARSVETNLTTAQIGSLGSKTLSVEQVTFDPALALAPQLSPDCQSIAFASNRGSKPMRIYRCDIHNCHPLQLTDIGEYQGSPRGSPDGRYVAFDSRTSGNWDIWVVGSEGGASSKLTDDPAEDVRPSWSLDGHFIYFSSNRSGAHQIWRVPVIGGKPIQLTQQGGFEAFEGRDQTLYYTQRDAAGLMRLDLRSGKEARVPIPVRHGHWAVTTEGIFFVNLSGDGASSTKLCFFRFSDQTTRELELPGTQSSIDFPGLAVCASAGIAILPSIQSRSRVRIVELGFR